MNLQYPIGEYTWPESNTAAMVAQWISEIDSLPGRVETAISGLSDSQLDTRYRPDGWTIRQVVHNLVDSHMNSYIRFKLALTEDTPTTRPYNEADRAELPEARDGDDDVGGVVESLTSKTV